MRVEFSPLALPNSNPSNPKEMRTNYTQITATLLTVGETRNQSSSRACRSGCESLGVARAQP